MGIFWGIVAYSFVFEHIDFKLLQVEGEGEEGKMGRLELEENRKGVWAPGNGF